MKLMFASDIHGSRSAMEAVLRQYRLEGANRLVLLGDLLYHGPRNDLPMAKWESRKYVDEVLTDIKPENMTYPNK